MAREINTMDPSLYDAAASGDVDFLRIRNASIDLRHQKTPKNNNILHIAAEFKQIDFFKQVKLKHKSPPFWVTNMNGDTPLHVAARVGCDEIVKFVINHTKLCPNEGADEESGAAADDSKLEAYTQLLRNANLEKETALHAAVRYSHDKVVSLLIRADPELCSFTNSAGESPLFLAIRKNSPGIASCILEESLKYIPSIASCTLEESPHVLLPYFGGTNAVTALHAAVTHRYLTIRGIVTTMVSSNPEIIKRPDALGLTALHYAALRGNLEATRVLVSVDSSLCYMTDSSGLSPLHVAAYAGHPNVMEELVRCRPDTCELVNDHGQTALHAAVLGGRSNVVRYILKTPKLAVLINEANKDGNTPLHLAAIHKKSEIIQILTRDRRVDIYAINKNSLNALDIFLGDDVEQQGKTFSNTTAFHPALHHGVPFFQDLVSRQLKKLNSPEDAGTTVSANIAKEREEPQSQLNQALKRYDTKLLVATLIATVTFAAGSTNVPGGFKTDGTPVLNNKTAFGLFQIFNTVSFYCSVLAICNELTPLKFFSVHLPTPASLIQYSVGGLVATYYAALAAQAPDRRPHESLRKYLFGHKPSDFVLGALTVIMFLVGGIPFHISLYRIKTAHRLRVLRRCMI